MPWIVSGISINPQPTGTPGLTTASVQWGAISGAISYSVYIARTATGAFAFAGTTTDTYLNLPSMQANTSYLARVFATVLSPASSITFHTPTLPVLAPTSKILVSGGQRCGQTYPDVWFNPGAGPANWRGVFHLNLPHGRLHTGVDLLLGNVGPSGSDRYQVAVAQGGNTVTPPETSWVEPVYPGALPYAQPALPIANGLAGVWTHNALTPAAVGEYVSWSVYGNAVGTWLSSNTPQVISWNESQLLSTVNMQLGAGVDLKSSAFTQGQWNFGAFGLAAWGFDVSGSPVYNIATVGDGTFSGAHPAGSQNEWSVEGQFHYANIDEITNGGMRWITSNWSASGYNLEQYLDRGRSLLSLLAGRMQFMLVQSWCSASAPSDLATARTQQALLSAFQEEVETIGVQVIFAVTNPQGSTRRSAGYDAGFDEMVRWTLEQGGFDSSSVVADPADTRNFLAAYSEDQLNLNIAGSKVAGPAISNKLTQVLTNRGAI